LPASAGDWFPARARSIRTRPEKRRDVSDFGRRRTSRSIRVTGCAFGSGGCPVGSFRRNHERICAKRPSHKRPQDSVAIVARGSRRSHDHGDCSLWLWRAINLVQILGIRCVKEPEGQSPLISVSQLLMTERSGPAEQGGGRL
jgi:hypothetical protein